MENAIDVIDLIKDFPIHLTRKSFRAVNNISFHVKVGEVYGLIGPNGSGKSTTMKVILGLINATQGKTKIFGKDSRKIDSRFQVGFLPENPYFYKYLTGSETLNFYGKLCGMKGNKLKERILELLNIVNLEHAKDRRIEGYSKGMLQRIGIAQALIHKPKMIFLDEPTAGVDPQGSREIRNLIFSLKKNKVSVILSSHLLEQVQEVCDRVGILNKGKFVCEGSLDDLISIENRHEILLENSSEKLKNDIKELINKDQKAKLLHIKTPKTTLENLFINYTKNN